MTSSTEATETIEKASPMDTSSEVPQPTNAAAVSEEKPVTNPDEEVAAATTTTTEEAEAEAPAPTVSNETNKSNKRKRSVKKSSEGEENNTSISNSRPKRNLSKREDVPLSTSNGTSKGKASRSSTEQANGDAEDEQEREKNIPITYDVADVVWAKMGGHPWWPSLIIRDPNDATQNFTKVTGNSRAKRMYFVVFFGSTADFAWVSDAAMIPYQGVEAFTKYAQEMVDKAVTKSQKEQLTERFQLKVTIGRREDWELAVREADQALKLTNEGRLKEIEPKIEFYTKKIVTPKTPAGRRTKGSTVKNEETASTTSGQNELSTLNATDRSLLAEKTFEFKSDDENDSSLDTPLRKTIKIKSKTSNGSDSVKRRTIPRATAPEDSASNNNTVFGQTANGSSVSYQPKTEPSMETPTKTNGTGRKRGRPSTKANSVSSSSEESPAPEFHSASPSVTTKFTTQRKPIVKPQAFANHNSSNEGKNDIRTGFLSPTEEQEVIDALENAKGNKTFEEAEQEAKRRFEHILCFNLNRTHVDVPEEWFYTFLFTHPSLIAKNPQWFNEKSDALTFSDGDLLKDLQTSNSLAVLKHQLFVLSKMYRNELQSRSNEPVKKRRSAASKAKNDGETDEMN